MHSWQKHARQAQGSNAVYTVATHCLEPCLWIVDEAVEEDSLDIQQAVSHIAEAALLGLGDASKMYPETLEEMYESYSANEMEFRVIL